MATSYMQLKYGSYTHEEPVFIRRTRETVERDDRYRPVVERLTANVSGEIVQSTLAGLKTKIAALVTAYTTESQNLIYYDTTETATDLSVTSASTLSGVRVLSRPELNDVRPQDYAVNTPWPYTISLEWHTEFITSASADLVANVIGFEERLSFAGGGAVFADIAQAPPIEGAGGRYRVVQKSPYTATQSGRVTYWHKPSTMALFVPAAIWPEKQMAPVTLDVVGPERKYGTNYRRWTVNYEYRFESTDTELTGTPNEWPS